MVIDHTSYAVSETDGDHTLIASDDFMKSDVMLGSNKIDVSKLYSLHNHELEALKIIPQLLG